MKMIGPLLALLAVLVGLPAYAAAPSYNSSGQHNDEDGGATATVSVTPGTGENRLLEVFYLSSNDPVRSHSGVTWNGTALTQRGTTLTIGTYANLSHWYIKEASFPGSAANLVATSSGTDGAIQLFWIFHENVDQASPFSNGSQTTNTGTGALSGSITITATADQAVVHAMFGWNSSADVTSIAIGTGTTRQEKENFAGLYCTGAAGTITGAAPNVSPSWSFTMTGGDDMNAWGMVGDALTYTAPGGGGGSPAFRGTLLGVGK